MSEASRESGLPSWVNSLSLVALVAFFFLDTTSRLLKTRRFDESSLGDFLINLSFTWRTLENGNFPPDFYYPLPYIAFYQGLGGLGVPAGALVWFALVIAGALATCFLASDLCGWKESPNRWLWVAGAIAAASYYVQWDLRTGNSNLIYLALLLGSVATYRRNLPRWAGLLLAASVSLKLYSVLLLPYLLISGRLRWLGWSLAWLVVAFVLIPLVVFGPAEAAALTELWVAKLLTIPDPAELPSFYKSLTRSLLVVTTSGLGQGANFVDWDPALVRVVSSVWKAVWALTLGAWFWRTRTLRGEGEPSSLLLGDVAVLALLPLPFSPTFQPHHAVVVLIPAFMLLSVVRRDGLRGAGLMAAGLLAGAFFVVKLTPGWPLRGVTIQLALWIYALSLHMLASGWLRTREAPTPRPA